MADDPKPTDIPSALPSALPADLRQHSPRTRALVIKEFRRVGRVDLACASQGVDRTTHYSWLKRFPKYAKDFEEARAEVAGLLEDEAVRRAYQGTMRPTAVAGKMVMVTEFSDRLLEFLLKCRNRPVFGDRAALQHTGKDDEALFPQAALEQWLRSEPDA